MDPQSNPGWATQPSPGGPPVTEQHSQLQQRNNGGFGSSHGLQQAPPMQLQGPVSLPPPTQGPFFKPPNGTALPSLAGLAQASPPQTARTLAQPQHQRQNPPGHHQQHSLPPPGPQQGPGYSLPALGQSIPQSSIDRERQYHESDLRELEERQRQHEHEILEQHRLERQRSPPEAHAGAIPLQQPTASRIPQGLHGPNGLLSANPNAGLSSVLGAPTGPGNVFAGNAPSHESLGRSFLQPGQAPPQHLSNLNSALQPQAMANGSGMGGQQPILNDALTYLDQVKVRFQDQPEVYNKFLDIMKDFKSQAIDTPGVIDRVSSLFNGHPQLIQGFNTFLPPGYKIEAGWDNNPNSIRVTTPSGSKIQNTNSQPPMHFGGRLGLAGETNLSPRQMQPESAYRPVEGSWAGLHQEMPIEGPFSPSSRPLQGSLVYGQSNAARIGRPNWIKDEESNAAEAAAIAHQQEQRGVTQLQNAAHAAETQPAALSAAQMQLAERENGAVQTVPGQNMSALGITASLSSAQSSAEKRPAVEFNHAISYVNKIKNRFATQPEIYKQFLEILQTYQRESKPIQDVYAQVTQLFNAAPDLLEDFKQFLPESAAQARAQAARMSEELPLSNERGDANYIKNMPAMAQTPKPDKMPPIGHFGPASVSKENKKRRGGPGGTTAAAGASQEASASKTATAQGGPPQKRPKINVPKSTNADIPTPSPSLVPDLPRPMPPSANKSTLELHALLERIKKSLGDKKGWMEFLKLLENYNSQVIDKNAFVARVEDGFLNTSHTSYAELSTAFRKAIGYSSQDTLIENLPAPSDNKVVLSNCRALGPSYRMLPKRERLAKCSGRDEMCYAVLNDDWASHPTWASEDSGFISHKKNAYEEALYRMEEERHDYDFNIETASRTIQLLEPLVQQMSMLEGDEKRQYRLPPGLGGQSEAIWQRVIKKLYDRQVGQRVIDDMIARPTSVCPVVLLRLKEKIEKWKQAQREWEKIWREQTHKQFWKSLDHQSINAKAENKKYFQPKQLQTDINAKHEEQRRQRQLKPAHLVQPYQFEFAFTDIEVVYDICHMLLTYLRTTLAHSDATKVENFIKNFIPSFFSIDKDAFLVRMTDVYSDTPPNEEDEDSTANDDTPSHRARRIPNGKQNLLRGVLDPSKSSKRESRMNSKESTPDVMSVDEDSGTPTDSLSDQPARLEPSETRWMEHPRERTSSKLNEPFSRTSFSLYANLNIYCFMRLFAMFYERLIQIKNHENNVQEDVRRSLIHKAAIDLRIQDRSPTDFFDDVSPTANYYRQIIKMCESFMEQHTEMNKIEETLKRFYIPCGYQLYSFDKWLSNILKFASQAVVNDAKDRNNDIINLFLNNRKESQTTHQAEIDYRKSVEKLAKDGEIYRIVYHQVTQHVTMQIFRKDDQTFDTDGKSGDFNWSYYVTAYVMRDWTEGVPRNISWPLLRRNLARETENDDLGQRFLPATGEEGLEIRISPNNYRLAYEIGTTDWWVHNPKTRARGLKGKPAVDEERKARFEDKFVKNGKWMAGLSLDEVNRMKADFSKLAATEIAPAEPEGEKIEEPQEAEKKVEETRPEEGEKADVEMTDA